MEILRCIVGGIMLGITESFPVSSGGHVLLLGHVFGKPENFDLIFPILNVGFLFAVIVTCYKEIWNLIKAFFKLCGDIFTGNFNFKKLDSSQNMLLMLGVGLIPFFMVFVPIVGSGTNVLGISYEFSDTNNVILAGVSFLINGILLKFGSDSLKNDKFKYTYKTADNTIRRWNGRKRLTFMDAVWCGVMQFISVIFPSVSHIGAVFSVGLIRGINRNIVGMYAFLLGMPATIIMICLKLGSATNLTEFSKPNIIPLLVGVLCSAISGFLFIKIFDKMIKENKILVFSFYTIALGVIMTAVGIFEQIRGINIFQGTTL